MRSERDDEMTPLGLELLEALEEVAAHRRGELELPVREVLRPEASRAGRNSPETAGLEAAHPARRWARASSSFW